MQIYTRELEHSGDLEAVRLICAPQDALFFDIATTGLSREENRVYLISCVSIQDNGLNLTQWFDDTGCGEKDLLTSFLVYSKNYRVLFHYNGSRFDLPFLSRRIAVNGLDRALNGTLLEEMEGCDLYQVLKPYKALLGLPTASQQNVEQFFGSRRTNWHTGQEMVDAYREFLETRDRGLLQELLSNSADDACGIVFLTKLLYLPAMTPESFTATRVQANRYRGADQNPAEELVIRANTALPAGYFPRPALLAKDGVILTLRGSRITVKVPLVTETMKYFYAGYQDYYYLPDEDMAVHKSIASFADASHRLQATPETCYTKKTATFIPEWSPFQEPFFKRSYSDSLAWFVLTDELRSSQAFFSSYVAYLFRSML